MTAVGQKHRATGLSVTAAREAPPGWNTFTEAWGYDGYFRRAEWLQILSQGLRHKPWFLSAKDGHDLVGVLPLAEVRSPLFGSYLVSLPYLNTSGVLTARADAAEALIDTAVELSTSLNVKHLELRHESPVSHSAFTACRTNKVHMRLALPGSVEELWNGLKSKVRSQVRKPRGDDRLTAIWGRDELLADFYRVFCINMRDLGTPPFSKRLFAAMLEHLPDDTEICCIRRDGQTIAAGILVHGPGTTTVPSASSLRRFSDTSCNMLMYWHLLTRAVERGQRVFDFGRSSEGSGTYRFKKQWGALPCPSAWQYLERTGSAADMRPESGKFGLMIKVWQRLPVWLTRAIGPEIVRGIP